MKNVLTAIVTNNREIDTYDDDMWECGILAALYWLVLQPYRAQLRFIIIFVLSVQTNLKCTVEVAENVRCLHQLDKDR